MIEADIPLLSPPTWAILERALIDIMSQSVFSFLRKYTREDGTLIWRDEFPGIDGLDDAYESFHNWPLLYALGGDDHLLNLSMKEFDAITRQFTKYGQVYKEYEQGYDWFHQGKDTSSSTSWGWLTRQIRRTSSGRGAYERKCSVLKK